MHTNTCTVHTCTVHTGPCTCTYLALEIEKGRLLRRRVEEARDRLLDAVARHLCPRGRASRHRDARERTHVHMAHARGALCLTATCSTTPPRFGLVYHVCGREWRSVSVRGTRMVGTPQLPVVGGRYLKNSVSQSALSHARPRGSGLRFIALPLRPLEPPSAAKSPNSSLA